MNKLLLRIYLYNAFYSRYTREVVDRLHPDKRARGTLRELIEWSAPARMARGRRSSFSKN